MKVMAGWRQGGAARGRSIRLIAGIEAAKGVAVLLAASGLLLVLHTGLHAALLRLVAHFHLNPAAHHPGIFLAMLAHPARADMLIAAGAAAYALLRFAEAWGLYRQRRWAEWLSALSGALYVPPEIYGLLTRPSWLGGVLLLLNLLVVAIMLSALFARERA